MSKVCFEEAEASFQSPAQNKRFQIQEQALAIHKYVASIAVIPLWVAAWVFTRGPLKHSRVLRGFNVAAWLNALK